MDETTQKALNEFVQQIISAAQTGAQWTVEQAPLVVQEWLRWQMAEAILSSVGSLLILGGLWFVALKSVPHLVYAWAASYCKEDDRDGAKLLGACISIIISFMVVSIVTFPNILTAFKVWISPRVIVLEKFSELIK